MTEKIVVFHNPECSKCLETMDILTNSSCEIEVIEYLKNIPSSDELKKALTYFNVPQ